MNSLDLTSVSTSSCRVLIAIPAYNEEATIEQVVQRVRQSLPRFDLLVINDGSRDATAKILQTLNVEVATHYCNLGYGRAIQTALKYALKYNYDTLITLDADGQHYPEQVENLYQTFINSRCDLLIGSRMMATRSYTNTLAGRRIAMQFFSLVTSFLIGQRIYDTTSGLKIINRSVFGPLIQWQFIDYHAEAIVYLRRLGYRVIEGPITIANREKGQSMYSWKSVLVYPLETTLLILLGIVEARLTGRSRPS